MQRISKTYGGDHTTPCSPPLTHEHLQLAPPPTQHQCMTARSPASLTHTPPTTAPAVARQEQALAPAASSHSNWWSSVQCGITPQDTAGVQALLAPAVLYKVGA